MSELLEIGHYIKLFVGLFAMVDPIAATFSFVALSAPFDPSLRARMAALASVTMLATFLLFLFLGTGLLDLFAISEGAFVTMGGVVLFLMGLDMLRAETEPEPAPDTARGRDWRALAIVPLAIPLLSGPGALATVVVYAGQHESAAHMMVMVIVLVALALVTWPILRFGEVVARSMGPVGVAVFNKVMGMIILAIAIEFLYTGISTHFPALASAP